MISFALKQLTDTVLPREKKCFLDCKSFTKNQIKEDTVRILLNSNQWRLCGEIMSSCLDKIVFFVNLLNTVSILSILISGSLLGRKK